MDSSRCDVIQFNSIQKLYSESEITMNSIYTYKTLLSQLFGALQ